MASDVLGIGHDGLPRCSWCLAADDYIRYHDEEWGRPVRGDAALFERLSLEAFQSGLSWLTVLRKRAAFRSAFAGFEPVAVAGFDEGRVEALLSDASIVRNRAKIEAVIGNARALLRWHEADGDAALDSLVWSYAVDRPRRTGHAPTSTPESKGLSDALRAKGFRFVGPTTAYAAMQACGVVDDHAEGCCATP